MKEGSVSALNPSLKHQNVSTDPCDTLVEYLISPQAERYIKIIIDGLLGCIGVMGIAGNFAAINIFNHKQMRSPNSYFLKCLAIFDNLFLSAVFYRDFIGGSRCSPAWTIIIGKTGWSCTIWATMCFAAKVHSDVFSAKSRPPWSYGKIKWLNFFIMIFAICFNIPHFCVLRQLSWKADLRNNFPYYYNLNVIRENMHKLPRWITKNAKFFEIWCMYLDTVFMYCIPLMVVFPFCLHFILALMGKNKTVREMVRLYQSQRPLDRIKVYTAIMVYFNVAYIGVFSTALPMYYGILESCGYETLGFCYLLVYAFSSVKFAVYSIFWIDFRSTPCDIPFFNFRFGKASEPDSSVPQEAEARALDDRV